MVLPQEIMACYGYKFPRHAANDWKLLSGTIRLHGRQGQDLLLDLAYRDLPKGEVAMRLAVEVDGVEYDPDELPAITPFPEASAP